MKRPRLPTATDRPVLGGKGASAFAHKRTREREDCVIAWLNKGFSMGRAADEAGISRNTLFAWRQGDAEFAARVDEAVERGTDLIEDEARRRAVDGVDRPVYQGGVCVGHVREYSDQLMQTILGGRRDKYRRQKVEMVGDPNEPLQNHIEVEFVASKG